MKSEKTNNKAQFTGNGNLTRGQKFFLSFPVMPLIISNLLIHKAFIKYYTDIIGLDTSYVALVYLVFGIWNAINDPAIGVLIDRRKYDAKRGKLLYLMKVTAPITIFASFAMIYAQPSWEQWLIFAFFITLLFIYDTSHTTFTISYNSFVLLAAPTTRERVDVSVFHVYLANAGGLLATIVPSLLLVGNRNHTLTIILLSSLLLVNSVLYFLALKPLQETKEMYLKENDEIDKREGLLKDIVSNVLSALKSKSFVTYTLFVLISYAVVQFYMVPFWYLADHVWEFSGLQASIADIIPGVALLLVTPVLGKYIKKMGAKKSMILGQIPTAFAFLMLFFVNNLVTAILVYCAVRIFSNFTSISQAPMLGAIIDEDEQHTGQRRAGLYNGVFALFSIPASGIQTSIFMFVLTAYSYVESLGAGEVQPDSALMGIRIGAAIVPFVFILVGIIPLLFSPLNKKKELELAEFTKDKLNYAKQVNGQINDNSVLYKQV